MVFFFLSALFNHSFQQRNKQTKNNNCGLRLLYNSFRLCALPDTQQQEQQNGLLHVFLSDYVNPCKSLLCFFDVVLEFCVSEWLLNFQGNSICLYSTQLGLVNEQCVISGSKGFRVGDLVQYLIQVLVLPDYIAAVI